MLNIQDAFIKSNLSSCINTDVLKAIESRAVEQEDGLQIVSDLSLSELGAITWLSTEELQEALLELEESNKLHIFNRGKVPTFCIE